MKKSCELCKSQARIYCESDQASLCWSCDAKVHSANFLVARHSRSLLCHVCQLPTAWNACGEKLGRTVSVCERCVQGSDGMEDERCRREEEGQGGNDDEIDTEGDYDDDDDDIDEDDDGDNDDELDVDDEDSDNQVVPWSSTSPPPSASSSSSGESTRRLCMGDVDVSSKRMRDNVADVCSDDDLECLSSQPNNQAPAPALALEPVPNRSTGVGEAAFVDSSSLRPSKVRKIEANRPSKSNFQHKPAGSRSSALVESLKRLHQQDMNSSGNASAGIYRGNLNPVGFGLSGDL